MPASAPAIRLARILSIGDELLFGRGVDTNAAFWARRLTDAGLRVEQVRIVGDNEDAIVAAMEEAGRGAALVVSTGGLGPTDDDRTRAAAARAAGVGIAFRAQAWRQIERYWGRNRTGAIPPANRRQAELPAGCVILANDRGTAPGFVVRLPGGCRLAGFPGVPHEMEAMAARFLERLPRFVPGLVPPAIGEVHLSGIAESAAQDLLAGLFTEDDPVMGITAHEVGHLTVRAVGSPAKVRRRIAEVRRRLAGRILPAPGLADSLVATLAKRRQTIAVAESCTGGHVMARLTAVPGASACLRTGYLAYHADAKTALGVDPALIRAHGVVSEAVAIALAQAARAAAGADYAIATTGIAGPDGGTRATPVGTVWIGVAGPDGSRAKRVNLNGSRTRIQSRAAGRAMLAAWELVSGA